MSDIHEQLLLADFTHCSEEMRHRDGTQRQIFEFTLTGTAAVLTASSALLSQYGEKSLTVVFLLLTLSTAGSVGMLAAFKDGRRIFVTLNRYVNEIRKAYLSEKPANIINKTGLLAGHKKPEMFKPGNYQALWLYLLATCSSVLATAALAALLARWFRPQVDALWGIGLALVAVLAAIQVLWVIRTWASADKYLMKQAAEQQKARGTVA